MLSLYLQMLDSEEERSRFERFYLRYRDVMFRVAIKLLHSEMDAEDAVHQAFLAILPHFSKIHEIDCPETRAYAVIITERKAIDLLRARQRISGLDPEEAEYEPLPLPGDEGLADAMARVQPPTDKGRRLKLYYMTQTGVRPPTFIIFCNDRELFHFSYQRYIENQLRGTFGLEGTPIRLIVRQRGASAEL